jgi:hypothetical protein
VKGEDMTGKESYGKEDDYFGGEEALGEEDNSVAYIFL